MKPITKEHLNNDLIEATSSLLKLARNSCWNKISENTYYILSEIEKENNISQVSRNKQNNRKTPLPLNKIIDDLFEIYENLYDINLFIYKSKKKETIIEISYYPKSNLDIDFYETVKSNNSMLHCKVGIPVYRKHENEKYDVNWHLEGIRHLWKLFWYRVKFKLKISY